MLGLWPTVRFLHVLSAAIWVGGQVVLSAVLLPAVRARLPPEGRRELLTLVGRRFGIVTVAFFVPVQVATGAALASREGVTWASLGQPGYGRTLATKLGVFVLVMLAAAAHGWANGAGRAALARAFAIASLLGSLVVVLLATALPGT